MSFIYHRYARISQNVQNWHFLSAHSSGSRPTTYPSAGTQALMALLELYRVLTPNGIYP